MTTTRPTLLSTVVTLATRQTLDDVHAAVLLAMHERAAIEDLQVYPVGRSQVAVAIRYASGVGEAEVKDVAARLAFDTGLTMDFPRSVIL